MSSRDSISSRGSVASTSKTGSTHSRGLDSTVSLDIEELKQGFNRHDSTQRSNAPGHNSVANQQSSTFHSSHVLTPSSTTTRLRSLTIGNSSSLSDSRSMFRHNISEDEISRNSAGSVIPDLFGLEHVLHEGDEEKVAEGVKNLLDRKARRERRKKDASKRSTGSSGSSRAKTPVAWKTPFEVDLPRDTPVSKMLADDESEVAAPARARNLGSHLTDEQNAWAGIDALLDMQSVDGSCAISTTDILPQAIVRAMKRDMSRSSLQESDGESEENDASNLRLSEIGSSRFFGNSKDLSGSRSDPDQLGISNGGLFDMFHWSEKDNVDESRQRKKKLNQQQKLRVTIKTNSSHSAKAKQTKFSDDNSLPSLSSFHDDDAASRSHKSPASEWDAIVASGKGGLERKVPPIQEEVEYHGENVFGVQFMNEEGEAGIDSGSSDEEKVFEEDSPEGDHHSSTSHSLLNDGLVLNEQVDSYIKKIQAALPSIVGDDPATHFSRNGKSNIPLPGILERPSPTSVAEDDMSAAQELPSLASLGNGSSQPIGHNYSSNASAQRAKREERKKEVKLSLAHQLKNSIKKIRDKGKSSKTAGRSEEKYFPEDVVNPNPRGDNSSLLTQGADGVNWESN